MLSIGLTTPRWYTFLTAVIFWFSAYEPMASLVSKVTRRTKIKAKHQQQRSIKANVLWFVTTAISNKELLWGPNVVIFSLRIRGNTSTDSTNSEQTICQWEQKMLSPSRAASTERVSCLWGTSEVHFWQLPSSTLQASFHIFCSLHRICLQCFDTVGWAAGRASRL